MHRRAVLLSLTLGGCASASPYRLGAVLRGEPLVPGEPAFDVPYVPTPDAVVSAMLDMAAVRPGERTIDLGAGDGRLAIAAAQRGADATGIEIDGTLVTRARYRASTLGLSDRVRFRQEDLFGTSLRGYDVVTLYLLPRINLRLRPRLLSELSAGARIVSHAFDMGDWPPDEHRLVEDKHVFLWTVPAVAGGEWDLRRADGGRARLRIVQRYSQVSGTLDGQPIAGATLQGPTLAFSAAGRRYTGRVGDAAITGEGWTAQRAE